MIYCLVGSTKVSVMYLVGPSTLSVMIFGALTIRLIMVCVLEFILSTGTLSMLKSRESVCSQLMVSVRANKVIKMSFICYLLCMS